MTSFLLQPTDVILPSGKQYVLNYDQYGNLEEIIMPGLTKHNFHTLTTLKYRRFMYQPPGAHHPFIQDYDSAGRKLQELYPSNKRRITYIYDTHSKLKHVFADWFDLDYSYYEDQGILRSITLQNRVAFNYTCKMLYEPPGAVVKRLTVSFNKTSFSLLEGKYDYHYDQYFRIQSVEVQLGNIIFKPINFTYSTDTGKLVHMKTFDFQYNDKTRTIIRDANIEITRNYDGYSRITDVWYKFNNYIVFTLEIKYDEINRIYQWRRKVGSSDLKAYDYVYDIDNNVMEVSLSGQPTWKYEHDANNNIIKITHHDDAKQAQINVRNQLEVFDGESYLFDEDGFLIKRDQEFFEYNSFGQLVRAFEVGKYDVHYFYDMEGRLVARRDILGGYLTQFFYSDIQHKDRITHIYDHSTKLATVLYYDQNGQLFAMEQDSRYFYIALDPIGSPIVIFNAVGGVVKQMTYDPLGKRLTDSAPDFIFIFGYKCGVMDHITKLIHLGKRLYDPKTGRYTTANYPDTMEKVNKVVDDPGVMNLYQHQHLVSNQYLTDNYMTGNQLRSQLKTLVVLHSSHNTSMLMFADITSWLNGLGYDMNSLIPQVSFSGHIRPGKDTMNVERFLPITSAFECAFQRDMQNFIELSTVPHSKVITPDPSQRLVDTYAPYKYLFGEGVLVNSVDGAVRVEQLDSANDVLGLLGVTLLNNSALVDVHFSIHGRDAHYFVKPTLNEAVEDVRDLSLRTEDVIGGVNVSVHRFHETSEIMKYVDIRLHGNHTVMNLRYGTTVAHEQERIMRHAQERAVELAWRLERERLDNKQESLHVWTKPQRDELVKKGAIAGYQAVYIRDVDLYPELVDDPHNIQFVPAFR